MLVLNMNRGFINSGDGNDVVGLSYSRMQEAITRYTQHGFKFLDARNVDLKTQDQLKKSQLWRSGETVFIRVDDDGKVM